LKTKVSKIASVFIPLLLGFGLIYYQYTTLSPEELNKILADNEANQKLIKEQTKKLKENL
jgi:hypothetical protein